jgi:folate-binding Fe-S cluster repair protein YgfZ
MAFTPFPPRQPSSSARLPLTLMTLDDWALATISGPDSEKYLQGQITADVSISPMLSICLPPTVTPKARCGATCAYSVATAASRGLSAAACATRS